MQQENKITAFNAVVELETKIFKLMHYPDYNNAIDDQGNGICLPEKVPHRTELEKIFNKLKTKIELG